MSVGGYTEREQLKYSKLFLDGINLICEFSERAKTIETKLFFLQESLDCLSMMLNVEDPLNENRLNEIMNGSAELHERINYVTEKVNHPDHLLLESYYKEVENLTKRSIGNEELKNKSNKFTSPAGASIIFIDETDLYQERIEFPDENVRLNMIHRGKNPLNIAVT